MRRPRMESSSSERRDESEESRSGGTRDKPGRGGRRVARPITPDGGRVAHHGVRQTTDGRARVGGPDQENLRRRS